MFSKLKGRFSNSTAPISPFSHPRLNREQMTHVIVVNSILCLHPHSNRLVGHFGMEINLMMGNGRVQKRRGLWLAQALSDSRSHGSNHVSYSISKFRTEQFDKDVLGAKVRSAESTSTLSWLKALNPYYTVV